MHAHYRAPSILAALVKAHEVRFQVKKFDAAAQGGLAPAAQQQCVVSIEPIRHTLTDGDGLHRVLSIFLRVRTGFADSREGRVIIT